MDLEQLKFIVDTSDLERASVVLSKLNTSVSALNKPLQEMHVNSKKVAEASDKLNESQEKTEKSTKKTTSVLERQQTILEFMAQGYSKGQSSQLAYAKAAGALTNEIEQLGKVLQTQRTLMGTDPFDKSIGALQSLKNEYIVIKEVQRLYNAELGLSKNQMVDLAREKLRLIEKFKLEGATLSQIKQGIQDLNSAYIQNVSAENRITQSIKARQKANEDAAKAQDYIAREFERVNKLTSDAGNITSATNNKLIAMEKALRMSGISASEQATKLDTYRKSLESIQKTAGNRQVDYLSRALGPQITDIFVGLATGQSPMMVLLQQGGQLRDQFALAGVAGKDMAKMLTTALGTMVTSVKDVAFAVGGLLVNAFTSAGSAIVGSLIAPFKALSGGVSAFISGTMTAGEAVANLGIALRGLATTGLFAVAAALAVLAIEYVKVTKANTDLSQSIALTGASLGMSTKEAISFAENLSQKTAGSTLKYIGILSEFAKANSLVDEGIITLAGDIDKYLGQSVKKTAEEYANLSNEPTKGLVDIAKKQGFVNEKTLVQVYNLEQIGKKTEAAKIAMEAYKASQDNAVASAKANLDPLQKLWIDIKENISQAGQAVYDLLKSESVVNIFRTAWETIAVIASEVWYVIKSTGTEIGGIAKQIAMIAKGDFKGAMAYGEQMKADAEVAKTAQDKLVESILNRNKAEEAGSKITAEQALANSNSAKSFDDRMKLQKEALDYFNGIMKEANKLTIEATQHSYDLNAAQKKMIEIISDPKFLKLSEQRKTEALSALANASALIEQTKAEEQLRLQNAKTTEEYIKNIKAQDDAWISAFDAGVAANRLIREEADALSLQANLIGATDVERKRAIKTRQIELDLAKELRDLEARKLTTEDQTALEVEARKRAAEKIKNLNTEIAVDAATKLYDEIKNIQNGISDSITTALFEGGQAGSKKLREIIVAELKKPITIVINAVVSSITGGLTQSATQSVLGSASGSILGSLFPSLGAGATVSGLAGAFGTGIQAGFTGTSTAAATQAYNAAGMSGYGTALQYGQYAAPVIGAIGGMAINKGISNGYQVNNTTTNVQNIATAVAAAINPVFGLIAGAISGVYNRAFGRKLTDVGIQGTVGGQAGFAGQQYTFEKGGWFRSDKTTTSQLDEATRSGLASAFRVIKSGILDLTDSIGIGSDAVENFSTSFKVNLKGLSEEDATKAISAEFAKIQEQMAKAALGTDKYTRQNETSYETLVRLSNFMQTINGSFKNLGFETYKLELASIDAAQAFVDLFGGIEGFTQAFSFFYENFFSDTEKTANLTRDLTTEFNKLGKSLPATREEFKQMVVTAKAAGDDQLVKSLLDLQYAFADLVPVVDSVTSVVDSVTTAVEAAKVIRETRERLLTDLQSSTDVAYAALERSVSASKKAIDEDITARQSEIDALDKQRSITESTIDSLNSLFDLLKSNIKELYNEADSVSSMTFKSARQFISNAATSGVLPDEKQLSDAIGSVRTGLDKNYYKTKADAERDRIILANELVDIQNLTEKQLTGEQKMLKSLDDQITLLKDQIKSLTDQKVVLDEMLVSFKEQIDVMRGVDTSIKDLSVAINDLTSKIAAETATRASSEKWVSSNGSTTWSSTGGATAISTKGGLVISAKNGDSFTGEEVVNWVTGQLGKGDALSVYQEAIATGISANSLDAIMGWTPGTSNAWAEQNSLPKFADGGMYSGGLALVGEKGPELIDFNQSGRVYNADQTSSLLGSSSEELAAIRQELVMLRAEVRADVSHNAKTAKILSRVTPDGETLAVSATIDGGAL